MAMIDMQTMRYINILDRVARVKTSKCFTYNNIVIFAVPSVMVRRAVGPQGDNVRTIQMTLGKRVKIISEPQGEQDVGRFVQDIVDPVTFKSVEFRDGVFVLTAGNQSKAALIGRNKKRLEELSQIVQDNFGKPLKII